MLKKLPLSGSFFASSGNGIQNGASNPIEQNEGGIIVKRKILALLLGLCLLLPAAAGATTMK